MHIVKIILAVIAYVFCVFIYGIMGPTANWETGPRLPEVQSARRDRKTTGGE